MPKPKFKALPESLKHLQPVLELLSKLRSKDLNEDLDCEPLVVSLRQHIEGIREDEADRVLNEDYKVYKAWLEESAVKSGAAHWVLGALLQVTAADLRRKNAPCPVSPEILINTPPGWKCFTPESHGLNIRKKGVWCILNPLHRNLIQASVENWKPNDGLQAEWKISPVKFGSTCVGTKYLYSQVAPIIWKSIDYFLNVPGGSVSIRLCKLNGGEFDDTEIEGAFHSLRLRFPDFLCALGWAYGKSFEFSGYSSGDGHEAILNSLNQEPSPELLSKLTEGDLLRLRQGLQVVHQKNAQARNKHLNLQLQGVQGSAFELKTDEDQVVQLEDTRAWISESLRLWRESLGQ